MGEFVRVEVECGIATIRLDRPKVNALNVQVKTEIGDAATRVSADDAVRAVVLYGGERVFAAGADIHEMASLNSAEMAERSARLRGAFIAVTEIPKPVVAAVTGYALGGGLELALCADFRVLGESAKVGQPEILLGIIPGAGGTQRLSRLIGAARAKDLIFSGRHVTASEALAVGLADLVVPDRDVYQAARDLATQYAAGPALALRAAKQAIDKGPDVTLASGLEIERLQFSFLFNNQDQKTGEHSFMAHGPGFKSAARAPGSRRPSHGYLLGQGMCTFQRCPAQGHGAQHRIAEYGRAMVRELDNADRVIRRASCPVRAGAHSPRHWRERR